MKYYIAKGTTPMGPFEVDELLDHGLTRDSLVWAAGMTEWVKATTVDELQGLFEQVPPPITPSYAPSCEADSTAAPGGQTCCNQSTGQTSPSINADGVARPYDWLVPSILVTVCCCAPLSIIGIIYAAQVNGCWGRGDYKGAIDNARKAQIWTIVGFVLAVIGNSLYAIFNSVLLDSIW